MHPFLAKLLTPKFSQGSLTEIIGYVCKHSEETGVLIKLTASNFLLYNVLKRFLSANHIHGLEIYF